MNRYLSIILILLISFSISACSSQSKNQGSEAQQQDVQAGPVKCTEPQCLLPEFLKCNPSELTMPFMEGATFVITVLGLESGNCRYTLKVVDSTGAPVGPPATDCKTPKEKITQSTFEHFFGQDKTPGKEAVKAEQDKIEADYCTKQ